MILHLLHLTHLELKQTTFLRFTMKILNHQLFSPDIHTDPLEPKHIGMNLRADSRLDSEDWNSEGRFKAE